MPRSLLVVTRFEMAKALRARLTWATLLLPAVVAAASASWVGVGARARAALSGDELVAPSAFLSFVSGVRSGFVLGGMLLLVYAAMIVSNEGNWRTFKTILARPHGRIPWIAGKYLTLLALGLAMATAISLASFAVSAWTGTFGDIAEDGYVIFEAAVLREETRKALLLTLGPLAALAAFGLLVSTLTDHAGIAAIAAVGGHIVLETVKDSSEGARMYLFNSFLPSLVDTSYLQAVKGIADGMSDTQWEPAALAFNQWTPVASAAVFLVLACTVFSRRNFAV